MRAPRGSRRTRREPGPEGPRWGRDRNPHAPHLSDGPAQGCSRPAPVPWAHDAFPAPASLASSSAPPCRSVSSASRAAAFAAAAAA